MNILLLLVLIGLMIMVVVSVVRGVIAFLKSTKIDLETGQGENATEMQLLQNRMMFARIPYQALAIVVIVVILSIAN